MTPKGPVLGRRQAAGLAVGALVAGSLRSVQAADASTFVSGFALPMNLDPHQVYDVPMQSMMLNAYDNLYRYQNDPPQIVPWLAESHTVSDDGLLWEFKLRPNIKFHDGSPMTAEDVVYSFRRVLALALAPAGAFLKILKPDNVTAPDPLPVRFKLETSYAPFFAAIPSISIVNPRADRAQREERRLGQELARLERRGLRFLSHHSRRLPAARVSRHGDQRGPFPRLVAQSQAGEEDRLPADQGNLDARAGPAERLARLHRSQPAGRPGGADQRLRRSPMSRRTWSCGPSSSA